MARIPLQHRGKRPRMFPTPGLDEMVSISLELMTELWVLKKRLYLLERAAAEAGVELTSRIENHTLSEVEAAELEAMRSTMMATVLRSLEANNVARSRVCAEAEQIGRFNTPEAA